MLLIKRDSTTVERAEGKVTLKNDAPDILRTPWVVKAEYIDRLDSRDSHDTLIAGDGIRDFFYDEYTGEKVTYKEELDERDFSDERNLIEHMDLIHRLNLRIMGFPALWSGRRSVLVYCPNKKEWYRLKGVAIDPEHPKVLYVEGERHGINGGLKITNAKNEWEMSDAFNEVLRKEGIEPIMEVKGIWEYPVKAGSYRPAAAVIKVKGDTRLDELVAVLESLAFDKMAIRHYENFKTGEKHIDFGKWSDYGERFYRLLGILYFRIGYEVGRLKRIMDDSIQTWSSGLGGLNSHCGNIVLYMEDSELKVGFVDFDTSWNGKFSSAEFRSIKDEENRLLEQSFFRTPISIRQITGKPRFDMLKDFPLRARRHFPHGVNYSYYKINHPCYKINPPPIEGSPTIEILKEILDLVRSDDIFSTQPESLEDIISRKRQRIKPKELPIN